MRLCALSVDLDEIPNYYAIHGLDAPAGPGATAVYDVALDRLESFARAAQLPLTLFAIGADLERKEAAAALRKMAERGHEIGNHTLDHHYDLTRRDAETMREQVEGGAQRIEDATGERPTGFRAPGYTVTDELFEVLEGLGVGYGSSVFPCPPYWLLKATKMAFIRMAGRTSRSILDRPQVFRAPTEPYRVGRPYWQRGNGLLELPIQVTRRARLPYIGTTLTMAGPSRARWLTKGVIGAPLVNLELHGIDVLDGTDGFADLSGKQHDADVPYAEKLEALSATVDLLRGEGYSFVRLDEAAKQFS